MAKKDKGKRNISVKFLREMVRYLLTFVGSLFLLREPVKISCQNSLGQRDTPCVSEIILRVVV